MNMADRAILESLPRPCTWYMNLPLSDFGRKMAEEDYETAEALGQYIADPSEENRVELALELTDKITAATSTLCRIGCDLNERMLLQRRVNRHNDERGRFCKGEEK